MEIASVINNDVWRVKIPSFLYVTDSTSESL